MNTIVIALRAKAGAGKTMAMRAVLERFAGKRISFAGPLKEMTTALLPDWDERHTYGYLKETICPKHGFSPRIFMQKLGQNGRELLGDQVWINAALEQAHPLWEQDRIAIIDDSRYVNEAEAVAALPNGYNVQIDCPSRESSADPSHPSEYEVDLAPRRTIYATVTNHKDSRFVPEILEVIEGILRPHKVGWQRLEEVYR